MLSDDSYVPFVVVTVTHQQLFSFCIPLYWIIIASEFAKPMADTMVAPHLKNPANDMNSRKNKKPLMEKRRRARINSCLTQLKSLVLQAIKKDSSQFSKLEKADILELTVKHLRALQRQQAAGVMTSDPNVASKYRAGFNECAKEIVRYISSVREVHDDVKERLLGHLAGCLQVVNHVTVAETLQQQQQQQQQMSMKPLHVHIPQQQQQQQALAAPSVIMHSHAQARTSSSALPPPLPQAAPLTAFAAPSPVNLRSSPPAREPSPVYSATPLSALPLQGGARSPAHLAGAFQVVPGACGGPAVALYLGHRDSPVSVDAMPLYTVSLPHSEAAFSHPALSASTSPPSSSSQLTSQGMTSHPLLDTSYGSLSSPSSVSSSSSSSSPRLTPPVKLEYSPLHSSALPVDLRQSHKVKAAGLEQPHHHHHQPLNFAQCGSSALGDEKLWRPW